MCDALEVPEIPKDPRFKGNRERIANNRELDGAIADAVARFTLDELMRRMLACEAAAAPVNNIQQIFEDQHFKARQNIVAIHDDELQGPVRFQNVAGKLSATPGRIQHAGPPLGSSNHEILVERLGFSREEIEPKRGKNDQDAA
jgi:formyl-CoA transferase